MTLVAAFLDAQDIPDFKNDFAAKMLDPALSETEMATPTQEKRCSSFESALPILQDSENIALYHHPHALIRSTPPHTNLVDLDRILGSIRIFLANSNISLSPPSRKNQNMVFRSPGEPSGTIDLPLWTQNSFFNSSSPSWPAFTSILAALRPLMEVMGRIAKVTCPLEYGSAEDYFLSRVWMAPEVSNNIRVPGPRPCSGDVFERVRIGANLACEMGRDGEQWMVAMWVGVGRPRLMFGGWEGEIRVEGSDVLVLGPEVELEILPFVGECYEIAFLMPNIEGGK